MNKKRITILNTAIVFAFLAIFLRLTDLMVFKNAFYSERAQSQQIKTEEIQARRGSIYDRRGRPFAVNVDLESLYCDPGMAEADRRSVGRLATLLDAEPKAISAKLARDRRFVWVERRLQPEKAEKVRSLDLKGFGFITEAKRFYPKNDLAAHIIGAVGSDNQPLEGLELKYDRYLRTSGGKVQLSRDASGRVLSSGVELETRGNDLVLTIDEGMQFIVEQELDHAMEKWRSVAASAIVMDPFTGEILALANRPAYDLNHLRSAGRADVRNRALTDIYEPGSTFKIIVGSGAIEERLYGPDARFDVRKGSIEVGGKMMRDAHRHDEILSFAEVIQKSSNVGSIMIGMQLGKDRIYEYAKRFGFGEKTGIDLPGEVSGWIRKPESWSATSIGAISIGQEVAATPLQVLRAYAAIANGGLLVTPHIVSRVLSPEGKELYRPDLRSERVISDRTARIFRDILKTVVEEGGTAVGAAVSGNQVAGKTGTAQLVDSRTKRYSRDRFISSFVGFVPADKPRFAMIVVVHEPKGQIYGGLVAGPVFRAVADQALSYLNVPRDDAGERNLLLVRQ